MNGIALLSVLILLFQAPADSRPSFYTLTQVQTELRLMRFEGRPNGKFTKTLDRTLLNLRKSELVEGEELYAELSPVRQWLALGVRTLSGQWSLLVINMTNFEIAFQMREHHRDYGKWFTWRDAHRLYFFREEADKVADRPAYSVFSLLGPNWAGSEARVSTTPAPGLPFDERQKIRPEVLRRAIERLKKQHYLPASRGGPGLDVTLSKWERYLPGSDAAMTLNGKAIAVLATKYKTRNQDPFPVKFYDEALYLLREKKGWIEERLPKQRWIRSLRFWGNWLVVVEGDLKQVDRQRSPHRIKYEFKDTRIRLYNLNNLAQRFEVRGDYFLATGQ